MLPVAWCSGPVKGSLAGGGVMVAESVRPRGTWTRRCVCCESPTASRSIPACWEHWNLLPEDLRSVIVKFAGRGDIKQYADCLLEAVAHWRQVGAWRSKRGARSLPVIESSAPIGLTEASVPIALSLPNERNIIPLTERRQNRLESQIESGLRKIVAELEKARLEELLKESRPLAKRANQGS